MAARPVTTCPASCHACLQGTHVVSGSGLVVVLATGPSTYIAGMAAALPRPSQSTAFDRALRRIAGIFIIFVAALVRGFSCLHDVL